MYINLFTKTEYSCLDSLIKLDDYLKMAKDAKLSHLSVCDNNLASVVKFYELCKKNDIVPIIGLEVYFINAYNVDTRLLLFPKNDEGYANLLKLTKIIEFGSSYGVSYEDLLKHQKGLRIVTVESADILRDSNYAVKIINKYKMSFDDFYLGISNINPLNDKMIFNYAKTTGVKPLFISETKYFHQSEKKYYIALKSITRKCKYNEISEKEYPDYSYPNLKANMAYKEAIKNTKDFFDTNLNILKDNEMHLKYEINYPTDDYLKALCVKGLERRSVKESLIKEKLPVYLDRLDYELSTIKELNFSDYFLIVYDVILYAKKNGILVGYGRGSSGGSLVCYCLGINDVDPIKYDLLFERFLNKSRINAPDIDVDVEGEKRDVLIKYLIDKYDIKKVGFLQSSERFQVNSVLNEVERIMPISADEKSELMKYVNAFEGNDLNEMAKDENLSRIIQSSLGISQIYDFSKKLQGLITSFKAHPSGIVITDQDIANYAPVKRGEKGQIIQVGHNYIEKLGLVKIDLLTSKVLSNIRRTLSYINEQEKRTLALSDIPLNDEATFDLLRKGDTIGVFQLSSPHMVKLLKDFSIQSFNEIALLNALGRPGAMDSSIELINRRRDPKLIKYLHVDLVPILKDTFGLIVYQEQILQILAKFGSFTYNEADNIRRAISKKDQNSILSFKEEFFKRGQINGYSVELLANLYDHVVLFANYGFNKSHAVSYAYPTYHTAYLKANYKKYYFAAIIDSRDFTSFSLEDIYYEAKKSGIYLLNPNINESSNKVQIIDNNLLLPLTFVDSINDNVYLEIDKIRSEQKFISYYDFVARTANVLSKNQVISLINSLALDSFGFYKKTLETSYDEIIKTCLNLKELSLKNGVVFTDKDEYNFGELEARERKAIKLNIFYNFSNKYAKIINSLKLDNLLMSEKSKNLRFIARLNKINVIKTKNAEEMAFLTVEDAYLTKDLVLFPSLYINYQHNLNLSSVYLFEVSKDKERDSLIVTKISNVEGD